MRTRAIVLLAATSFFAPAACGARTDLGGGVEVRGFAAGDVADVEVLLGSCDPEAPFWFLAGSLFRPDDDSSNARIACAIHEKSRGCRAILDCFHLSAVPSSPCTPSCSGDVGTRCASGFAITEDCGARGKTCNASGQCIVAGEPCDATFVAKCEGDVPATCHDGVVSRDDVCASRGLVCQADIAPPMAPAVAGCTGLGPPCDSFGVLAFDDALASPGIRCDGERMVLCVNSHEHEVDCGGFVAGATCQAFPSVPEAPFCGFGTSCDGQAKPLCADVHVVLCNGGVITAVDCTQLGFTTCANGICVGPTN